MLTCNAARALLRDARETGETTVAVDYLLHHGYSRTRAVYACQPYAPKCPRHDQRLVVDEYDDLACTSCVREDLDAADDAERYEMEQCTRLTEQTYEED